MEYMEYAPEGRELDRNIRNVQYVNSKMIMHTFLAKILIVVEFSKLFL